MAEPEASKSKNSSENQELVAKIRENEREIIQLRKRLADYSIKEAQIRRENNDLQKRIADFYVAFDQQQQNLEDAESKASSYRQQIVEENIHLAYAMQVTASRGSLVATCYRCSPWVVGRCKPWVASLYPHFCRSPLSVVTFCPLSPSSLPVVSISLSAFVTVRERKETRMNRGTHNAEEERFTFRSTLLPLLAHYSLQPPDPDARSVVSNLKVLFKHLQEQLIRNENQDRMGLVPQSVSDRDISGGHRSNLVGLDVVANKVEADESGGQITSENSFYGVPMKTGEGGTSREPESNKTGEGGTSREPESNNVGVNDDHGDANRNGRETSSNRSSDADEDPLPALEDLQIFGDALPGRELLACGFSINGTSICNFEWIRHFEDGSVNIIDGAMRPNYLVTADDVDTYLSVQVLPLDDRNRKGEPVMAYANDKKKITCDSEMQSYIEMTLHGGHASYEVSLSTGYLDIWEPATLAIKRHGYSIKCRGPSGVVVSEKFSPSVSVVIPYGHVSEFVMICSNGDQLLLRTENNSTDAIGSRDTIVLILRNFIVRV